MSTNSKLEDRASVEVELNKETEEDFNAMASQGNMNPVQENKNKNTHKK